MTIIIQAACRGARLLQGFPMREAWRRLPQRAGTWISIVSHRYDLQALCGAAARAPDENVWGNRVSPCPCLRGGRSPPGNQPASGRVGEGAALPGKHLAGFTQTIANMPRVNDLSFTHLEPVSELFSGTDRLLLHHSRAYHSLGMRRYKREPSAPARSETLTPPIGGRAAITPHPTGPHLCIAGLQETN